MTRVALLGTGLLGSAFADGMLSRRGTDLTVWNRTRAHAEPLAALRGCVDIDIWPTPLTNSLPVWRTDWVDGKPQAFTMAWIYVFFFIDNGS